MTRLAVVTGASSGIGAATARQLAADGFRVVCAARRAERIEALAEEIGGQAVVCDVTSVESVAALADAVGERLDVLVNNAGAAFGFGPVVTSDDADWRAMFELNVMGALQVTRALLPALERSGDGLLVFLTSTAAFEAYEGGAGYTVTKAGLSVLARTLRQELLGRPVRISEIAPGMVATEEFGLVRFDGDRARRDATYAGVAAPLTADDIAAAIGWVASRPSHVDVDLLVLRPRAQASQTQIARDSHPGPGDD